MTVDFLDPLLHLLITISHHSWISYPFRMLLPAIPAQLLILCFRLTFSDSIRGIEAQPLSLYADYIIITQTLR